jgi:hypothetical protein
MTCSCKSPRVLVGACRAVLSLALISGLGNSGCVKLLPSGSQLEGQWVGRVRPVTVRDQDGREYQAAALEIERGPRTFNQLGTGPYTLPDDLWPLLARSGGPPTLMLTLDDLKVAPGSRMRVKGIMLSMSLEAPAGLARPRGGVNGVSVQNPWKSDNELVILLSGEPGVVRE